MGQHPTVVWVAAGERLTGASMVIRQASPGLQPLSLAVLPHEGASSMTCDA